MQPLKPEEKAQILANRPEASPAEVAEYEKLLSERFTVPPEAPAAAPVRGFKIASRTAQIDQRLKELHAKLFGKKHLTR